MKIQQAYKQALTFQLNLAFKLVLLPNALYSVIIDYLYDIPLTVKDLIESENYKHVVDWLRDSDDSSAQSFYDILSAIVELKPYKNSKSVLLKKANYPDALEALEELMSSNFYQIAFKKIMNDYRNASFYAGSWNDSGYLEKCRIHFQGFLLKIYQLLEPEANIVKLNITPQLRNSLYFYLLGLSSGLTKSEEITECNTFAKLLTLSEIKENTQGLGKQYYRSWKLLNLECKYIEFDKNTQSFLSFFSSSDAKFIDSMASVKLKPEQIRTLQNTIQAFFHKNPESWFESAALTQQRKLCSKLLTMMNQPMIGFIQEIQKVQTSEKNDFQNCLARLLQLLQSFLLIQTGPKALLPTVDLMNCSGKYYGACV